MIKGSVTGGRETAGKLEVTKKKEREAIRKSVGRLTLELLRKVKAEKLSGQVLNVRTGRLRRSITQRVTDDGRAVQGIVGTNVGYAKFHEFGTSIKDDLKQRRRAFKASLVPAKPSLVPSVDGLPPRSFLRSALKEMEPRIREEFAGAVRESSSIWRLL